MKFRLERIENINTALGEICNMDIISDTSFRLGAVQSRVFAAFKTYNKILTKLRDKYGKWKYRLEKEVLKGGKTVKEYEVCTLEGPAGQKHLVGPDGKRVEGVEPDWNRVYWEPNSDEDGESFLKEFEKLKEQEVEIKLNPIPKSSLVRLINSKEEKINLRPVIMATLEGIIVEDEEEKKATEDDVKELVDGLEKLWNMIDPEEEEEAAYVNTL